MGQTSYSTDTIFQKTKNSCSLTPIVPSCKTSKISSLVEKLLYVSRTFDTFHTKVLLDTSTFSSALPIILNKGSQARSSNLQKLFLSQISKKTDDIVFSFEKCVQFQLAIRGIVNLPEF